jgi:hypothetical protein
LDAGSEHLVSGAVCRKGMVDLHGSSAAVHFVGSVVMRIAAASQSKELRWMLRAITW